MYHAKTKHIDMRFHNIRELVSSGELLLEKIHISKNAADMLIKHFYHRRVQALRRLY